MVESEIRCGDPISTVPGQRKVVALVGATGVGKTTTIAKLAANLRLREGVKMGLVTVDTYRIAAVETIANLCRNHRPSNESCHKPSRNAKST